MSLGFHTSIAGGLYRAVERAAELRCTAMQMFSRNPRSWALSPITGEDIRLFKSRRELYRIAPVAVHTTYLINLSSPDDQVFWKSLRLFMAELERAELLGAEYLVTHLGSSPAGSVSAMGRIEGAFESVLGAGLGEKTAILVENSAGGGYSFGGDLADIGVLLRRAQGLGLKAGLCFDTCHGFAAGYPMREGGEVDELLKAIDRAVGLERLKLIHLNDSKGGLGSRLDRHEHIGKGRIGKAGMKAILGRSEFNRLPIILETPKKKPGDDRRNLRVVKGLMGSVRK